VLFKQRSPQAADCRRALHVARSAARACAPFAISGVAGHAVISVTAQRDAVSPSENILLWASPRRVLRQCSTDGRCSRRGWMAAEQVV